MADIDISRAHSKSVAEVRQIAEKLIGKLAKDYDLKHQWDGDTLKFDRSGLSGALAISPKDVRVTAKLGMMLKMLKGRIETELGSALERALK